MKNNLSVYDVKPGQSIIFENPPCLGTKARIFKVRHLTRIDGPCLATTMRGTGTFVYFNNEALRTHKAEIYDENYRIKERLRLLEKDLSWYKREYGPIPNVQTRERVNQYSSLKVGDLIKFINTHHGFEYRVEGLANGLVRVNNCSISPFDETYWNENRGVLVERGRLSFTKRVHEWAKECFGAHAAKDTVERNHRFLEESLELVQACGCTKSEAIQLVDYVFGRDKGEVEQEVGGVMTTLATLCEARGLDMEELGEKELKNIYGRIYKIRMKQANKPKMSPLPE